MNSRRFLVTLQYLQILFKIKYYARIYHVIVASFFFENLYIARRMPLAAILRRIGVPERGDKLFIFVLF